jgi:uncharacterized membrane protein YeaQ/YmgE (transglycosylase-associated protein family)
MGIMHIVWSVIVGFVIGLVARALMPGVDHMGFFATAALGIVGSFVGGFLGNLIKTPSVDRSPGPLGLATAPDPKGNRRTAGDLSVPKTHICAFCHRVRSEHRSLPLLATRTERASHR